MPTLQVEAHGHMLRSQHNRVQHHIITNQQQQYLPGTLYCLMQHALCSAHPVKNRPQHDPTFVLLSHHACRCMLPCTCCMHRTAMSVPIPTTLVAYLLTYIAYVYVAIVSTRVIKVATLACHNYTTLAQHTVIINAIFCS